MNKVYKTVWNKARGQLVAVSEAAHGDHGTRSARVRKSGQRSAACSLKLVAAAVLAAAASFATVSAFAAAPAVPPPENPNPGVAIGTGAQLTNTLNVDALTGALLNPGKPTIDNGALSISKDNITTAYSGPITIDLGPDSGLVGALTGAVGKAGSSVTGALGDILKDDGLLGSILGPILNPTVNQIVDVLNQATGSQLADILNNLKTEDRESLLTQAGLPSNLGQLLGNQANGKGIAIKVPVSLVNTLEAAGQTLGTGHNQHLTMLGGAKSESYITDVNRGFGDLHYDAGSGVLTGTAPAWATDTTLVSIGDLDLPTGILADLGKTLGLKDTQLADVKIPVWAVNAAQDNQVIVGSDAVANGSQEVVIGTNAKHTLAAKKASDVFPGAGTNDKDNPSGVPNDDYASRLGNSVVIGDSANGDQDRQTLLGANATSNQSNSVAVGFASNANRGAQAGYTAAFIGTAQNSAGEVAVGSDGQNRQITHVAPGGEGTDAVNVAQLTSAINGVAASGTPYYSVKSTDSSADSNFDNKGATGTDALAAGVGAQATGNGSVAVGSRSDGKGHTLAAGSNSFAGGSNASAYGNGGVALGSGAQAGVDPSGNVTAGAEHATAVGGAASAAQTQSSAFGQQAWALGAQSTAIGSGAGAFVDHATALGFSAFASNAYDVALGDSSDTAAPNTGAYTINGDTAAGLDGTHQAVVSVGGARTDKSGTTTTIYRQIQNVAPGVLSATSTDAVNGSQLYATNEVIGDLDEFAVKYDKNGTTPDHDNVTLQGTTYDSTTGTGGTQIHNVGQGTAGGDAVNVDQLNAGLANTKTHFYSVNSSDAAAGNYNNDGATGTNALAAGVNASATGASATAVGAGAKAAGASAVAVGSNANQDNADSDFSTVVGSGNKAHTYASLTDGSQLTGASFAGEYSGAFGWGAQAYNRGNTAIGTYAHAGNQAADAKAETYDTALGYQTYATGGVSTAIGSFNQATGAGSVAVGFGANAPIDASVALGAGSAATAATPTASAVINGTTYNFAGAAPDSVVSVGGANQMTAGPITRQVQNVAAGQIADMSTDAINGSQLYATNSALDDLGDFAVKYDKNGDGTVNYGSVTLNPGNPGTSTGNPDGTIITTGGTKLTNVASAGDIKDPTNGLNGVNAADLNNAVQGVTSAGNGGGFGLADASGGKVMQDLGKTIKVYDPDGNIVTTADAKTGELKLALANNITVGPAGKDGVNGANGQAGVNGVDGAPGVGLNGDKGSIGITGAPGTAGEPGLDGMDGARADISVKDGAPGLDGNDGKDGLSKTRIVYQKADGTVEQVATLNDGLRFSDTAGDVISRKLNETLPLFGKATTAGTYSSDNVKTVATQDGGLEIQFAETPNFKGADMGGKKLTGVADGEIAKDSKDAVNGGQLNDVKDKADSALQSFTTAVDGKDAQTVNKDQNKANFKTGKNIKLTAGDDGIEVATADDVSFENLTVNKKTTLEGDTVLNGATTINGDTTYTGPITQDTNIVNKKYVDQQGTDLTNKGMSFTGNDATAGVVQRKLGETLAIQGEASAGGDYSGTNLKTVTDPTTGAILLQMTNSPKFGDVVINADGSGKITGVADGEIAKDSKDAVNGGQLQAAGDSLVNVLGGNATYVNNSYTMTDIGGTGKNTIDEAIRQANDAANAGWNLSAQGENSSNVGPNGSVDLRNTDGNIVVSKSADSNNVNFDLNPDLKVDSVTTGNTTMNNDGVTVTGGSNGDVVLGNNGLNNGGNQITNVASGGDVDTNAANIGDVKAAVDGSISNNPLTFAGDTGANVERKLGQTVNVTGGQSDKSKLTTAPNVGVVANGTDSLSVRLAKDVDLGKDGSVTVGGTTVNNAGVTVGGTTVNDNGVTIKDGPSITQTGVDAGGQRVTNMAPGQQATDGATVGQVSQAVGSLQHQINKVGRNADAGVASAIASANLPQPYQPGTAGLGASVGTFRGQNALAVGVSGISENGSWVFKGSLNFNSQGKVGAGGGFLYVW